MGEAVSTFKKLIYSCMTVIRMYPVKPLRGLKAKKKKEPSGSDDVCLRTACKSQRHHWTEFTMEDNADLIVFTP